MRHTSAEGTRRARVGISRVAGAALFALLAVTGCDREVTAPVQSEPNVRPASVITITPGLTAYTTRATWEAAVVAAGSTSQLMDFTGLSTARVTLLDTDYSIFHMTVDRVSPTASSNPGLDVISDAGCSVETGNCSRLIFNVQDPDAIIGTAPRINSLVFPQNVNAFFGYFYQVGYTAGGTPTATGRVTLHIGADSVVLNDYLDNTGTGFFGIVSTNPGTTLSITFEQSGSIVNDVTEVYRPSFANAPPPPPPPGGGTAEEQLADLLEFISGLTLVSGDVQSWANKLDAFAAALAQGRTAKACTELDKFERKVNDKTPSQLIPADAAEMIEMVNGLRETLGCG